MTGEQQEAVQLVVRGMGAASAIGGTRRVRGIQDGADPRGEGVLGHTRRRRVRAKNLPCAREALATMQAGGDNMVDTIFEGLQDQSSLKITSGQKRVIELDNHDAVKIGDLERNTEVLKAVRLKGCTTRSQCKPLTYGNHACRVGKKRYDQRLSVCKQCPICGKQQESFSGSTQNAVFMA